MAISTGLSIRRQLAGFALAAAALAILTAVFAASRDSVHQATALACYLLAVVVVAAVGGIRPAVLAAIAAPLLANWFLIEPLHTLTIRNREDVISLIAFVGVAIIVSGFVSAAARRATLAERARNEAETLARLAAAARSPQPLQTIADHLRASFALTGVSIADAERNVIAASGAVSDHPVQQRSLDSVTTLSLFGEQLDGEGQRVLDAFCQQLSVALQQGRLTEAAERADALGRAEALRTALLQAVSHDLRTPLAGIKASVSSLRQTDIEWPADVQAEFLGTIENETDRLTRIITNLLDVSRLQAGAVQPNIRPVAMEEIIPASLHLLGATHGRVDLDLPDDLDDVDADPALLEQVMTNVIGNAIKWSPPHRQVTVRASRSTRGVDVSVIDHGPGIRPIDRARVLQPFHRLGDAPRANQHDGIGLGLAIANGFTNAMGGSLALCDTPKGGLTVVVSMPVTCR